MLVLFCDSPRAWMKTWGISAHVCLPAGSLLPGLSSWVLSPPWEWERAPQTHTESIRPLPPLYVHHHHRWWQTAPSWTSSSQKCLCGEHRMGITGKSNQWFPNVSYICILLLEGKRLIEWTMNLFSCCSQEPDLSVCFLPSSPLFLPIPSALLWRSLGTIQRRCSDKTPTFRKCSCDVYQSTGPAIKACSANLYW